MAKVLVVIAMGLVAAVAQDQFVVVNRSFGKDAVQGANVQQNRAPMLAKRRMMDTDPAQCFDEEGRACEWMDFNACTITSSGNFGMEDGIDTYTASKAIDGSARTRWISAPGSGSTRFWKARFTEPQQFSMVVLHSDTWPAAYEILVDGVQCAIMRSSQRAPCGLSGSVVEIRLLSDAASVTMVINEVQIASTPLIRRIICPFIATLVNEGVLSGCKHTKEKLFEVTIASGLPLSLAMSHIDGNFANNPSGMQDVCDMESAANEHDASTGIRDCPTDFSDFSVQFKSFPGWGSIARYSAHTSPCNVESYISQLPEGAGYYSDPGVRGGWCRTVLKDEFDALRQQHAQGEWTKSATGVTFLPTIVTAFRTPDKDCGLPNIEKFDQFFEHVDENYDNYLTVSELTNRGDSFDGIDFNKNVIAEGSISGAFILLLEIFGLAGDSGEKAIYRSELKRILIQSKFPHGYTFGHHVACLNPEFPHLSKKSSKFCYSDTASASRGTGPCDSWCSLSLDGSDGCGGCCGDWFAKQCHVCQNPEFPHLSKKSSKFCFSDTVSAARGTGPCDSWCSLSLDGSDGCGGCCGDWSAKQCYR
jgi:hypothetical protein